MKTKAFLLLFFFVIFTSNIYAQMTMIGIRTGVNLATEKSENPFEGETISLRPLFLGGVQVDFQFTNLLAISLQLLYDQKGSHVEMSNYPPYSGPYEVSTADWTISYLEVPILAKVYFGNSNVRPYLFGGPSIGFLLRNIEKLHATKGIFIPNGSSDAYSSLDTVVNITDSTAKFDFSLIAGVGISLTLTSGVELFLDAGYAFGLNNTNNYYADKAKDYYVYSRDIRIAVGILFPLH